MYAIVDIAGQQFKVEKDQKIYVHRLEGKEGSKVEFDRVLLVDNDGKIDIGTPLVNNTVVKASIVSHVKGDKVKVFKKKRRKGYQVLNGHRQAFTELLIEGIGAGTAKAKTTSGKKAEPKTEAKTAATEKKTTAETAKKAAPKGKTPAAKKPETKSAPKSTSASKSADAVKAAKKPAADKDKKPAAKSSTAKKPASKSGADKKPAAKKTTAKETKEQPAKSAAPKSKKTEYKKPE